MSVNLPSVSVPANLAVGQTIPGATASFAIPVNCTVNPGADWYMTTSPTAAITLVAGFSDVYTTSGMGAGVGFRMRNAAGVVMAPISYAGATGTYDMGASKLGANVIQGTFELVKTGTVATGSFGFSDYAHVPSKEYANGGAASKSMLSFNYTVLNNSVASCSVTTTNVAVSMPYTNTSAFKGIGTTASATHFDLGLQCDPNAKPAVSFTDSASISNQTNTLTLAPGSTAAGVGVQLLYQNVPVTFGSASYSYTTSSTPTTTGVALGTLSGVQNIPFQARYIQTAASVTPGLVKAIATFTMNYN
ncbi:fimbrial protein [Paraburkholderia sp. DHOC27]|uniref:fimbrial protein n=1 Tax=Paraburkholderia sp. DHOC27 TaxID=2303330 RepID=UPI0015F34FD1|nr:fimbrial protein [Paraburkholderia sp. DHOC27]